MAQLSKIKAFLDKELKIKSIKDSSRNGLQIKEKNEVKKVGFAVDGCVSTFEKAKKQGCDLLIVHHGIKWVPQKYKQAYKMRESFLKKSKISLYGAHLPLDAHPKYGNNIELARILDLKKIKKFGAYHGPAIGFQGTTKKPLSLNKISQKLEKSLKTKPKIINFGKKSIKTIGIISGGGGSCIEEVMQKKIDCFVVGEINQGEYVRARDYKINIIEAGHYATETLGVKALMPLISKTFKVKVIFIDNPTGQ